MIPSVLLSFRMALGAGCRCFFGLIFFVKLSVTAPAVFVKRFGVIFELHFFHFGAFNFLFAPFLFEVSGDFTGLFVALDAPLNLIAFFQIGQRLVVFVVVTLAATIFVQIRVLLGVFLLVF